jgi:hypothetical protein
MAQSDHLLVQHWRQGEHGSALLALLHQLNHASPKQVKAALLPYLAQPDWLNDLVARAISALSENPECQPPLRVIRSDVMTGMIIADTGYIAIAPLIIDAAKLRQLQANTNQTVSFAGGHSLSYIVRSGGAGITLFSFDPSADPACQKRESRILHNGEIIACDDSRDSMMIHPGAADLSMIRVYIRTPKYAPVMEFCAQSGALIRQASNDDAGSRSQMMLTMLRHAAHPDAAHACAMLLACADADTRWQAMREWLAIDGRAALPALYSMAQSDADAAVRDAARATLCILQPEHERAIPCPA